MPEANRSTGHKVVFIGQSTALRTLRTWARGSGLIVTEEPVPDVLCVVADDRVLDGQCNPEQGERLATSRQLGLECLPPTIARDRLINAVGLLSERLERESDPGSIYPC